MTIDEWKQDFKSFINELQMLRDDYNGIMAYIDDGAELLKEHEAVKPIKPIYHGDDSYTCDNCGETVGWEEMACCGIDQVKFKYCPGCGRKVKWDE